MPRLRGCSRRSGFKLPVFPAWRKLFPPSAPSPAGRAQRRCVLVALLLLVGTPPAAAGDDCLRLLRVDIQDSPLLSPRQAQDLAAPFLGRCLDAGLTQALLAAISNRLIADGYVTSRPYLQEQDVSDGRIEVRLLPGRIEAIVDADSGRGSRRLSGAFLSTGEILNLRELESSLEMIERVPSARASIEIRPGSRQGGSRIEVATEDTDRFRLELGANAQSELDSRFSLLANWDNPLDFNDILQLRFNDGELREAFQSNRSRELDYSFALGKYLLSFAFGDIEFKQRVQGSIGSFVSEGETESQLYRVSRIVGRNQRHRLTAALGLGIADTENFFEGERVDVSSYRTSKLQLEIIHDWYLPRGQLVSRLGYHRGLDEFGARDDDYFVRDDGAQSEARLQFEKWTYDGRLVRYLENEQWYYDLNLFLQYSGDLLFDSDKLNLGSPGTVRGYSSALAGSNAGYLNANLTWQLQSHEVSFDEVRAAKSLALSVGLDYGKARCEIDNPDTCGEIYAAGLGLVLWDSNFSARLSWGFPLKKIGEDIGDENLYLVDLRWSL